MTDDTTYSGPYARAAHLYRAAGWNSPIPLGFAPGRKAPPPTGYTGWAALTPSGADVQAWTETHGGHNIGLHLPQGVYVLDVDQYKDKTGADNLAQLGALPATWTSTARPGMSRHYFYRASPGEGRMWKDHPVPHTESLHSGHRYSVVWPSVNPDAAAAPYLWYRPDGTVCPPQYFPSPMDLTELPAEWIERFTQPGEIIDGRAADDGPAAATIAEWATDPDRSTWCGPVRDWADAEAARLDRARHRGGDIREPGQTHAIIELGRSGHLGVPHALAWHRDAYVKLRMDKRGESDAFAGAEWWRQIKGSIGKTAERQHDRCRCAARNPVEPLALLDVDSAAFFALVEQQRQTERDRAAAVTAARLGEMIATLEPLPKAERAEAVRRLIPEIATWPAADQAAGRAALSGKEGLSSVGLTEFGDLLKAELKDRKRASEEAAAAEKHARHAAAVSSADAEGLLLPPPHDPLKVAETLAPRMTRPSRWWRGDFYQWDGTRYAPWAPEAVDNWLYRQTAEARYEQADDKGLAPWRPTETKIGSVSHALSRGVLYRESGAEPDDSPSQVACANGVYDVPTGRLLEHEPGRFNLQSVPFAFNAAATAPTWQWFLNDVLPADAQVALQEFFGYVISGRTDLEKIFNLVGRRRSGKGTISTVLDALVGEENCAAPSMPSLVGTFGEAPLIGKTLATFSDISWTFRDIAEAVEIVKKISGNDARDVNRKNRDVWHGKLGVRFLIMGNDMPKFTDASGALAGRLINIQFPGSFYGRERPSVKTDLLGELPGILNWALAGLARLNANGRFTVPQTSEELTAEIRRQQSPVQGFLDDLCAFPDVPTTPVPLDELFPVYRAWARSSGTEHALDRERFGRALASAGLNIERKMIDGVRAKRIRGIAPVLDGTGVSLWVRALVPLGAVPPLP